MKWAFKRASLWPFLVSFRHGVMYKKKITKKDKMRGTKKTMFDLAFSFANGKGNGREREGRRGEDKLIDGLQWQWS